MFVLKILRPNFFDMKILQNTFSRSPRGTRLSEASQEKKSSEIWTLPSLQPFTLAPKKIYFSYEIHSPARAPVRSSADLARTLPSAPPALSLFH